MHAANLSDVPYCSDPNGFLMIDVRIGVALSVP